MTPYQRILLTTCSLLLFFSMSSVFAAPLPNTSLTKAPKAVATVLYAGISQQNLTREGQAVVYELNNDTSWHQIGGVLPAGHKTGGGHISNLVSLNGLLYAGGEAGVEDAVRPISFVQVFKNGAWNDAGTGLPTGSITSLVSFNGKLYAGGVEYAPLYHAAFVKVLDNGTWKDVGRDLPTEAAYVSLLNFNDQLYAALGDLRRGNNLMGFVKVLNNDVWTDVGTGLSDDNGYMDSLINFNNDFYVGGEEYNSKATPIIKKLISDKWTTITDFVPSGTVGQVMNLVGYNGVLYAAGYTWNPSNTNMPLIMAQGDKGWVNINNGLPQKGIVNQLLEFNGSLYSGGYDGPYGLEQPTIPFVKVLKQGNWVDVGASFPPGPAGSYTAVTALSTN